MTGIDQRIGENTAFVWEEKSFEFLEHTADMGIAAYGSTLDMAFEITRQQIWM